jgi:hypothetical protein
MNPFFTSPDVPVATADGTSHRIQFPKHFVAWIRFSDGIRCKFGTFLLHCAAQHSFLVVRRNEKQVHSTKATHLC